ncbi:zinc-binding dehydrogenase [Leuconostoc mesenteroides]|uniref:zinc-binding dehydrogenase n=1 Tax=Leuconostoc mesenteroides TaxID=1245 RepID=UPI002361F9A3|nr:zinc-binding dehydrogenase [Leuconostoc mesenteroides]
MLNNVYRLIEPRRIVKSVVPISINDIDNVIIRPLYLSVCKADQRYYTGSRNKKTLDSKLPMALIHEGVAEVAFDCSHTMDIGTHVAIIPIHAHSHVDEVPENYSESSTFSSSTEDGFLSEYMNIEPKRLLTLDFNFPLDKAVYLEPMSVAIQAINRLKISDASKNEVIGVWGDGNVAYIISVLLKKKYPSKRIVVFGKHREKLAYFNFVETILIDEIPDRYRVDQAIEAVGGVGSEAALNQIFNLIRAMGTIVLAGVSENNISISTRIVLEKGLTVAGTTRSTRSDFEEAYDLLQCIDVQSRINLLTQSKLVVHNERELVNAFDQDLNLSWGKTIIDWRV